MKGRPKNPSINSRNESLIAVMSIFEKFFFKDEAQFKQGSNHSFILQKARFISERAQKYNIELDTIELKKKLFQPYLNGGEITLSVSYINRICDFLENATDEYGLQECSEPITSFRYVHQESSKAILKSQEHTSQKHLIIKMLTKDPWYVFERIGAPHIMDNDFGIAVGEISFTFKAEEFRARMQFVYEGNERVYIGNVSFDASYDYMYLDLILDGSGKRASITLRLAEYDSIHQTIILGHFTYHSKLYSHLITKAVVFQKVTPGLPKLKCGDINYTDQLYKSIDPSISKFLYPRDKNRLSLPSKIISNEKELSAFIDQQTKKINPILKKHFQGTYSVFYKNPKGTLIEDSLKIGLNPNASNIEATYIHRPDISKRNNKKWKGTTYFNNKFIVLELSEVRSPERNKEEDPILLTFYTSDEDLTFSECECFPGLISGLQDSLRSPISYLCLLVKHGIEGFSGLDDMRLKRYFDQSGSTNLTPSVLAFKLDKLDELH